MDNDNKNEHDINGGKTSLFEIVDDAKVRESADEAVEEIAPTELTESTKQTESAETAEENESMSADHLSEEETKQQTQPAEVGKSQKPNKDSSAEKPTSVFREILSWIEVLVIAVAVALICNNFIIANSTVPTGSMEHTIEQGDRVIGSRISYYIGDPQRGDIAIFKFGWICNRCGVGMGEGEAPEICTSCGQKITHPKTLYYLKRTIGVPGDVIEIKAEGSVKASELQELPGVEGGSDAELVTAAVYVNGEKIDEPYLREPMLYTGDMKFEVPEDCYFFMGDNRNYSLDARYWENSYISKDKIIAKVLFRYFPNPTWLDN